MLTHFDKIYTFKDARQLMEHEIRKSMTTEPEGCYKQPVVDRIEIPVEKIDCLTWLSLQTSAVKIYGSHQSGLFSIAGVGQAVMVTGDYNEPMDKIFQRLRVYLSADFEHLFFYGGFCFDGRNPGEEWKSFGSYKFVIPQFEIAAKGEKMIFCCTIIRHGQGSKNLQSIIEELNQLRFSDAQPDTGCVQLCERTDEPDREAWSRSIQTIQQAIDEHTCEKVVLARKTVFHFDEPLNPWSVMRQLKEVTPNSYHFCFQFAADCQFIGASPERLFARSMKQIESEAIAGTRPRGSNQADDSRIKNELVSSEKEQHEHQLVVDMIQERLNHLCENVTVNRQEILSIVNGHHLKTKISGLLKEGARDEDILDAIHPTAAVGGVPTEIALDYIRALEGFSRGWYAAPIGFVGLDQVEFVVAIRSALIQQKEMILYAGAGIVRGSTAQGEWQEIEYKISNFLRIIKS